MTNLLSRSQQGRRYADIPKDTRAAMTRLADHIDEVDQWYATLGVWEKMHWKNPQTIAKHCPQQLLTGKGHNLPPRKSKSIIKKKGNPEAEALRAILVRIINKYVMPVDAEEAKRLLEALYPSDPDDVLEGLWDDERRECAPD